VAKSLQEQLLGAGLVDSGKARKLQQEKRKAKKQKKAVDPEADARREAVEKARQEKAERDRAINLERKAQQEKQALKAQVLQLLERHGQSREGGETPYQFVADRKVRKLLVLPVQAEHLASGRLAIIWFNEKAYVVPPPIADRILERDPDLTIIRHTPAQDQPDEDDPYKDFQIPDDLMW